jgi:hypothetical protein
MEARVYPFGCVVVPFIKMLGFLTVIVLTFLMMVRGGRLKTMRVLTQTRYGKSLVLSVMGLGGSIPFMFQVMVLA